jgi:hypothetical protein
MSKGQNDHLATDERRPTPRSPELLNHFSDCVADIIERRAVEAKIAAIVESNRASMEVFLLKLQQDITNVLLKTGVK